MLPILGIGVAAALIKAMQNSGKAGNAALANRSIEIAKSQLGVKEKPLGSNNGPEVKDYLKSAGVGAPNNWCMAFVYWCVNRAAKELGIKNPLYRTALVLRQWQAMKEAGRLVKKPQAGDIFIMDFGNGKGHTGFVTGVSGDRIFTIEGNSNDTGGRNGIAVVSKPNGRKISTCKGFIRL